MAWHGALPIVGIVVLVALVIAFAIWWDRKRTEEVRAWAKERGWTFRKRDPRDRPRRFHDFEPFGQGASRQARFVITGEHQGRAFELFEYRYTVQHGKSSTTYQHRVAALPMPLEAPDLLIRDEHLGHKLWDAMGGEDIDFESDEFSRRYWVRCRDRRFAYDVIDPRMMQWLLDRKGLLWQWRGPWLLLVTSGSFKEAEMVELLEQATAFAERVPMHVLSDTSRYGA